ncbi:hypothetical protein AB0933_01495 [Streptomyces venezuelae]|uniref:hypothetical protein n=1 Tax=Streptomyces venezuelae TaxID=54571 RepID=UPI003452BDC6
MNAVSDLVVACASFSVCLSLLDVEWTAAMVAFLLTAVAGALVIELGLKLHIAVPIAFAGCYPVPGGMADGPRRHGPFLPGPGLRLPRRGGPPAVVGLAWWRRGVAFYARNN